MKKKSLTIIGVVLLIGILISCNNHCLALGDVAEDTLWDNWRPSANGDSVLSEKTGVILGIISLIGIFVSVISLSIIGIRTVFGSAEEKAQYKQLLVPWTIGAILTFSVTTIPAVIYKATNGALSVDIANNDQTYINAYDDTIISELELIENYVHTTSHGSATIELFDEAGFLAKMREKLRAVNQVAGTDIQNRFYDGKVDAYGRIIIDIEKIEGDAINVIRAYKNGYKEAVSLINNGTITKENIDENIEMYELDRDFSTNDADKKKFNTIVERLKKQRNEIWR